MKRIILLMVLSWALGSIYAQQSGISFSGGVGTYALDDLKNYQDDLIGRLPVEAKGFSCFPAYTNLKLSLFKQSLQGLKYGLIFAYATTGAHANYQDYSGYLNLNQNITALQLGILASYQLLRFSFFELNTYGNLQIGYVRDMVKSNIRTNYYYEYNSILLSAVSPLAELGVETLCNFGNLSFGLEGGYLLDFGSEFSSDNPSLPESLIPLRPASTYRSQLSGIRLGVKVIFWISNNLSND